MEELFIDSKTLADLLGISHEEVVALIEEHRDELEESGELESYCESDFEDN